MIYFTSYIHISALERIPLSCLVMVDQSHKYFYIPNWITGMS